MNQFQTAPYISVIFIAISRHYPIRMVRSMDSLESHLFANRQENLQ